MGRLTTHVLDTANGVPAAGISVRAYRVGNDRQLVANTVTNADGRTDEALLAGDAFTDGEYELEFDVGAYFDARGAAPDTTPFLQTVVIRVCVDANQHYHVPLLTSPWSYSTYRGS
ncbi:MAG: hydroxyisourate hydrolase [Woeseiaceae bacterium]|nr:hydroxyisourate hydrolase [Woeseiaceae bacterium]